MSPEAIAQSANVLGCGFIGQGPQVEAFELKLQQWVSSPYVLSLNSGTSALQLALRLAGVEPGDEVISTPMTCMATNVPIMAMGARIVWADINPLTGNICAQSVAQKVTAKTKAIVCVDWGGYPCDLNELRAVADAHGLALIEDAAHAFGAKYQGRYLGAIPDFTTFSFQAIKHITTVDGGALICRDASTYRRGKLLRWYGIDRDVPRKDFRCEEDVVEYGYKFHMNDVAATIGIAQLDHAARIVGAHQRHAASYREAFAPLASKGLTLLDYQKDRESAHWLFTFLVPDRADFVRYMTEQDIMTSQVHARNDGHTVFWDFRTDLPGVDQFSAHQVCIPVGWWLTEEHVQRIIGAVDRYFRHA